MLFISKNYIPNLNLRSELCSSPHNTLPYDIRIGFVILYKCINKWIGALEQTLKFNLKTEDKGLILALQSASYVREVVQLTEERLSVRLFRYINDSK